MLASVLIIGFSLILLVYWFRYTCILLLRNSGTEKQLPAADLRLDFARFQDALNPASGASLESLRRALDRDYEVLSYLLEHAPSLNRNPFERHVLAFDYRLMRIWYCVARATAPAQANGAIEEMASIVRFLAQRIGREAAHTPA